MNKKYLITTALVVSIYVSIFVLSSFLTPVQQRLIPPEITIISPQCPDKYPKPVGIAKNGNSFCKGSIGLIRYSTSGKTEKILAWENQESPQYLTFHGDYFLKQQATNLEVYYLPTDATIPQKIGNIPLERNESIISSTAELTVTHLNHFYISTYREVTTPAEPKAIIYDITVSPQKISIETRIPLHHMEQVNRIYRHADTVTLVTKPQFSFVFATYSIISLRQQQAEIMTEFPCADWQPAPYDEHLSIICTNTKKYFTQLSPQNNWQEKINLEKSEYIWKGENIKISESEHSYIITSTHGVKDVPKDAISQIEWQVHTIDSTTIEERVYNCSDFGESEQISLRVCTLNHE